MITLPDSQIYSFFLDQGPGKPGTFLFKKKIEPQLRPKVGDSISIDISAERFTITRDEIPASDQVFFRVTEDGQRRITEDDNFRITDAGLVTASDLENITHNYFVTPSNNPNRIVSWTTNKFAEDQTLKQLFDSRFN